MEKLTLFFVLLFFSSITFGQEEVNPDSSLEEVVAVSQYDLWSPLELSKTLKEGCEQFNTYATTPSFKEKTLANCFELGQLYVKNAAYFKGIDIELEKHKVFVIPKDSTSEKLNYQKLGRKYIDFSCRGGMIVACEHLVEKAGEQSLKSVLSDEEERISIIKKMDSDKGSPIILWAGILLIGIAVLIITRQIVEDEDEYKAQEKLEDSSLDKNKIANYGIILKYARPFFRRYLTPVVSQMKNKKKIKEKYIKTLACGGVTGILSSEDFYAFKLFLILAFPVVFMVLKVFLEADWSLFLVPVVGVAGFFYPDFWIRGRTLSRQREVIMAMPFSVDMLALSVEAGMDFMAAIGKVVEKGKDNPLREEFENMLKEVKVGASRAEALRKMAWRIDLIEISSFCATLIAADSVGASIGPILKALSKEIRQKKSAQIEKAGATAATKILFPMIFFIVPAVMIIVFAPIVMEAIGGAK